MARNKYPEITVDKILEASQRLFLEKGYDNTTIQDIVNELNGLSKGAIYHHFKSKEEIMSALGDRMFFQNNPFEKVKQRTDLNGLEKMKLAILLNPRILAEMIATNRRLLCPYWMELLEEGQKDGSVKTPYTKELAEFLILTDIWMIPSVFPATKEELQKRLQFIKETLEHMGLPLIDDEIEHRVSQLPYFE